MAGNLRFVIHRARADRLVLVACAVTVVLTTTLLAAGPMYADAVTTAGVRRTLQDAPVTAANVRLTADGGQPDQARLDLAATEAARSILAPTGGTIIRSARSRSFALPGQGEQVTELTTFASIEELSVDAELVEGGWPEVTAGPVQAVLSTTAAERLGLRPGDRLTVISRFTGDTVAVELTGVFRILDPEAPAWWADPLLLDGATEGGSFTTFGPFLVDRQVLLGQVSPAGAELSWTIVPDHAGLRADELEELDHAITRISNARGDGFAVETGLPALLDEARQSLLVTRSGVLIATVQVAILALYALLLAAGMVVRQRDVETALLRSRGASSTQVLGAAAAEGVVLAVPAVVAAPWLARAALSAFGIGPVTSTGLTLQPRVGLLAYLLAAAGGIGCVVALAVPALRSARSFQRARQQRGRQLGQGVLQRTGADLLLVAVAALGYWQLRTYGGPLARNLRGRLGLDPLLIAAPALGLLAGAVLCLRLVPLLARAVERGAVRRQGLTLALGSWQVARRPAGHARGALLPMLALAIGVFAVTYGTTWTRSQGDQATYRVGTDVRVSPDTSSGAVPAVSLAGGYAAIDGVQSVMPAWRDDVELGGGTGDASLLALDAATAPDVVRLRPDLAGEPVAALVAPLEEARPSLPAITLPAGASEVTLELAVALRRCPAETGPAREGAPAACLPAADRDAAVEVVLQDRHGLLHEVAAGTVPTDGRPHPVAVPLRRTTANGTLLAPAGPLGLVAVQLEVPVRFRGAVSLFVGEATIGQIAAAGGGEQSGVSHDGWVFELARQLRPEGNAPRITASDGNGVTFSSPSTFRRDPVELRALAGTPPGPSPLPAIATDGLLASLDTDVGSLVSVPILGTPRELRITAAVRSFPTLDPHESQGAVVVDLASAAVLAYADGRRILAATDWWLDARPGTASDVADRLAGAPFDSAAVLDRDALARDLRTDPIALGILGALALGFAAAAGFAVIGFTVNATVAARERIADFALLRAVGLSSRELAWWLRVENGLMATFATVAGVVVGLVLAYAVLPFAALTQSATEVVPAVHVVVPWLPTIGLALGLLAVLLVGVGLLARRLRRLGLGAVLRLGEEGR